MSKNPKINIENLKSHKKGSLYLSISLSLAVSLSLSLSISLYLSLYVRDFLKTGDLLNVLKANMLYLTINLELTMT